MVDSRTWAYYGADSGTMERDGLVDRTGQDPRISGNYPLSPGELVTLWGVEQLFYQGTDGAGGAIFDTGGYLLWVSDSVVSEGDRIPAVIAEDLPLDPGAPPPDPEPEPDPDPEPEPEPDPDPEPEPEDPPELRDGITIRSNKTAQFVLPILQAVPDGEEPVVTVNESALTVTATFSTGLRSVGSYTSGGRDNVVVTSVDVFDGDSLLFSAPSLDLEGEIDDNTLELDPAANIQALDVNLVSNPDTVDADAYLAELEVFSDLFFGAEVEAGLDVRVNLGELEPSARNPTAADADAILLDVNRANLDVSIYSDGSVGIETDGQNGNATFSNLERLLINDGGYGFYYSDDVPEIYRLYAAAFVRTPDEAGLKYWDDSVNVDGILTAQEAADYFVTSPEFMEKYPDVDTNSEFIDQLYINILGRPADAGGRDFWTGQLDSGAVDRGDALYSFAQSQENIDRTIDDYDQGVWVVPIEDFA